MLRVLPLLVAMLPAVWCRLLLIETREENTTIQNGGAPPPAAPALPRKRGYSEQLTGGGGSQPPSVSGDDIASYVPFSDYGTIFRDDKKFYSEVDLPFLSQIYRFLADNVCVRLLRLRSCCLWHYNCYSSLCSVQ
jgi:hypothetical protein